MKKKTARVKSRKPATSSVEHRTEDHRRKELDRDQEGRSTMASILSSVDKFARAGIPLPTYVKPSKKTAKVKKKK